MASLHFDFLKISYLRALSELSETRGGSTGVRGRNLVDGKRDFRENYENEKEDQGECDNPTDERTVYDRIEPHQIVICSLLTRMMGTLLGLEMLNAEHIIGG